LSKYFSEKKEERKLKIIELFKVNKATPSETHLLEGYISDEDIDDINYEDELEEYEDQYQHVIAVGNKKFPKAIKPNISVISHLVTPFHVATQKILL